MQTTRCSGQISEKISDRPYRAGACLLIVAAEVDRRVEKFHEQHVREIIDEIFVVVAAEKTFQFLNIDLMQRRELA